MNVDLAPIVRGLLEGGALSALFRALFPVGAVIDVPISRYEYRSGPVSAVLCDRGCSLEVRIRNIAFSAPSVSLPFRLGVTVDVSVASKVAGRRAPLPIATTLGDIAIDVDTTRGRNDLRFVGTVIVGSPTTPRGFFRARPSSIAASLRSLGADIDISELTGAAGQLLEADDLTVTGTSMGGRFVASALDAYKEQLVARLRAEAQYALNHELCTRLEAPLCPPKPPMPDVTLTAPPAVKNAVLFGLVATLYFLVRR